VASLYLLHPFAAHKLHYFCRFATIKLLVEAIRVAQVVFSMDKRESMLSAICYLGEVYYKKNMQHDSIAALQWALSIGEVLQSELQKVEQDLQTITT